jgi:exo-beta-1,3-glucanase (GH17 family)
MLQHGLAALAAVPMAHAAAAPRPADLSLLRSAMAKGRFVTYQPTGIHAINGKLTQASDDSIRADLQVLRPYFDSLITYGAQGGAERIADIASGLGFRAVVMGVWDFYNKAERANAIAAAKRMPHIVAGLSLGNEMILSGRAAWGDLEHMLAEIRAELPAVPLTVTEAFAEFLDSPDAKPVLAQMDFLMANVHPIFEPWFRKARAENWADFVARVSDLLAGVFPGPVLIKETGIPTGPPSLHFTQAMQHDFYRALEKRFPQTAKRAFSYFSAFDAPWRASDVIVGGGSHPEEAHWGLFDANRAPKEVMRDFPVLPKPR